MAAGKSRPLFVDAFAEPRRAILGRNRNHLSLCYIRNKKLDGVRPDIDDCAAHFDPVIIHTRPANATTVVLPRSTCDST